MRTLSIVSFVLFSSLAFAENPLTPLGQELMDALIYGDRAQKTEAAQKLQSIFTPKMKNEAESALQAKIESMNRSMPQRLDESTVALGGLVSDGLVLFMYEISVSESEMTHSKRKQLIAYLQEQMTNQACTRLVPTET